MRKIDLLRDNQNSSGLNSEFLKENMQSNSRNSNLKNMRSRLDTIKMNENISDHLKSTKSSAYPNKNRNQAKILSKNYKYNLERKDSFQSDMSDRFEEGLRNVNYNNEKKGERKRNELYDSKDRTPYNKNHFPQSPRNHYHNPKNIGHKNNHPYNNYNDSRFNNSPNYPINSLYNQNEELNYNTLPNYYSNPPQSENINPYNYNYNGNGFVFTSYPTSNMNFLPNHLLVPDAKEGQSCIKCEEIYKHLLFNNLPLNIYQCIYCNSMLSISSLDKFYAKYNKEMIGLYKEKLTETLKTGSLLRDNIDTIVSEKHNYNFKDKTDRNEYLFPRNDNYKLSSVTKLLNFIGSIIFRSKQPK